MLCLFAIAWYGYGILVPSVGSPSLLSWFVCAFVEKLRPRFLNEDGQNCPFVMRERVGTGKVVGATATKTKRTNERRAPFDGCSGARTSY